MATTKPPTTAAPSVEDLMAKMAELQSAIDTAREREATERQAALMTATRERLNEVGAHITVALDATESGTVPAVIEALNQVIMMCQEARSDLTPTMPAPIKSGRPRNGACRAEVLAHMKSTPGVEYTATEMAHELDGRSSGQIANEFRTLANDAESGVMMTCESPKRYAYTATDDATSE